MTDGFDTAANLQKTSANTGPVLLDAPRHMEAGAGARWLAQAWTLFKAQPGLWLGMSVVFLVWVLIINFIPVVNMLVSVGFGVLMAGWIIGAYELDEHQNLKFEHLFAGFQHNMGQLLLLGVLYLAAILVIGLISAVVFLIFGGISGGMGALMNGDSSAWGAGMIMGLMLGCLVFMALIVPVAMAIWFAPALIALNGIDAVDAMKRSFAASMANMLPFLVYGLVLIVLTSLAMLTLGLGLIVLLPVLYISYYTSYREVLTEG
jgi:uncharacterized membrane protein